MQSLGSSAAGNLGLIKPTTAKPNLLQEVLNAYIIATPRTAAFDAAVAAYRKRNPEVSDDAARQAVAAIICGKD